MLAPSLDHYTDLIASLVEEARQPLIKELRETKEQLDRTINDARQLRDDNKRLQDDLWHLRQRIGGTGNPPPPPQNAATMVPSNAAQRQLMPPPPVPAAPGPSQQQYGYAPSQPPQAQFPPLFQPQRSHTVPVTTTTSGPERIALPRYPAPHPQPQFPAFTGNTAAQFAPQAPLNNAAGAPGQLVNTLKSAHSIPMGRPPSQPSAGAPAPVPPPAGRYLSR